LKTSEKKKKKGNEEEYYVVFFVFLSIKIKRNGSGTKEARFNFNERKQQHKPDHVIHSFPSFSSFLLI